MIEMGDKVNAGYETSEGEGDDGSD